MKQIKGGDEMNHPEKWRETCDPFQLNYQTFKPIRILGYPHAGNDVFHVVGLYEGKETRAYIKVARQKGAAIENELSILRQLDAPIFPKVLDAGTSGIPFIVTEEMPGLRLSVILKDKLEEKSLTYMEEYGETLGRIHQLSLSAESVVDRRFFHTPSDEMLKKLELSWLSDYFAKAPSTYCKVFCHGDFHYANVLWTDHHISGILDFELSGWGNRDFDIAWALILRPGQTFMHSEEERRCFLKGYKKCNTCDEAAVQYYMAQIYVYFLSFCGDDKNYCEYVRRWLSEIE